MRKRILFLVVLMLMSTLTIMAQITTSSMSGKVTFEDAKGEEVIGATVVAVHEPSGSRYTAVTNVSGLFTINGMRTGGPYEVTVSYIGYQPKTVKGVTLELAETYNLNVWLSEDANVLTEVVVSGKASKFAAEKTGASTNISNAMIANLPTVNRTITDVVRLSPYGGNGMSLAGGNAKMSNFTVDGANFNDNFGLSTGLPGNGNPISLDAIEEMQVVISPFDVRQTNFIGGGVNAITKSGTNTFKGSAYIYHKNENMQGDAVDHEQIAGMRESSRTTTYGFTLGGPIIKNKLFFFVSGEMVKSPGLITRWRPSENGVADADNYQSRVSVADMDKVSQFVKDKYGYDTGSYTDWTGDKDTYKLLARLDWNITDKHHLSLRYNYTKSNDINQPSQSTSGFGSISYPRVGQYAMSYMNSTYKKNYYVKTFAFDLNSRLTNNLSNQFLLTYSKIEEQRETNSKDFPFVDILDGEGNAYISLGYEPFSWNNAVNNKVLNIKDDITYYLGNHTLTGGVSYEYQMAENIFMKYGSGYYRYANMDDFFNAAAPVAVGLTYGYDGAFDPGCRVNFNQLGVYAQDDWRITDKFKLTYGLRFDGLFFNNNDLMTNNAILALNYNGKTIDTGKWPSSTMSVSPRVGFTWDVFGDKSLKVRGGTGLFLGRLPLVFFTNMPSNANMYQLVGSWTSSNADMSQFVGPMKTRTELQNWINTHDSNGNPVTDSRQALGPYSITPEEGTVSGDVNGINSDFKMPQVWKTSLAVDYQIPVSFPFTVTVEGMFNKTVNGVFISNWALRDVAGYSRLNGVDNRPIYQNYYLTYTDDTGKTKNLPNAYVLDNTSKGYGWTANVTLNAQPFEWMSLMAAYTHTVQKELTGMPGSSASSAFQNIPSVDGPNFLQLHNSQFVIPDRVIASATIHDKANNHYSLIYEGWRGSGSTSGNISYMLTNNITEEGNAYDLIYIPTDLQVANNEFRFVSEDDKTRFMDFVHNNDYLSKHQGEYAEAFSHYSPWVHRIDFSYKHDFKLNVGKTKHTLQLSFDMKNVLNFFNSSWGVAKYLNPDLNSGKILKYEGRDAQGYATFSTPKAVNGNTETWTLSHSSGQCWFASIGIKYIFN